MSIILYFNRTIHTFVLNIKTIQHEEIQKKQILE